MVRVVARVLVKWIAVAVAVAVFAAARLNVRAVRVVGQRIAPGDSMRVRRFRTHLREGTGTGRAALGPEAHEPRVLLVAITTLAGVQRSQLGEVKAASVVGANVQTRTEARRRFLLMRTNLLRQFSPLKMTR